MFLLVFQFATRWPRRYHSTTTTASSKIHRSVIHCTALWKPTTKVHEIEQCFQDWLKNFEISELKLESEHCQSLIATRIIFYFLRASYTRCGIWCMNLIIWMSPTFHIYINMVDIRVDGLHQCYVIEQSVKHRASILHTYWICWLQWFRRQCEHDNVEWH